MTTETPQEISKRLRSEEYSRETYGMMLMAAIAFGVFVIFIVGMLGVMVLEYIEQFCK